MMCVRKPHWSLDAVKRLASGRRLWVQKGRGVDFFSDARSAVVAACRAIASLGIGNFAHSQELTWYVADVYGFRHGEVGWYLKLCIEGVKEETKDQEDGEIVQGGAEEKEAPGSEVLVISMHPLERPIKTNGGWVKP